MCNRGRQRQQKSLLTRPSARKSPNRVAVRLAGVTGIMDLGGWGEPVPSSVAAALLERKSCCCTGCNNIHQTARQPS